MPFAVAVVQMVVVAHSHALASYKRQQSPNWSRMNETGAWRCQERIA
jgi:hypothetical protein